MLKLTNEEAFLEKMEYDHKHVIQPERSIGMLLAIIKKLKLRKYDPLYSKINHVLRMVDQLEVLQLINNKFLNQYGNNAPGECFKKETEELQAMLDEYFE